jgi:hypothetical protein
VVTELCGVAPSRQERPALCRTHGGHPRPGPGVSVPGRTARHLVGCGSAVAVVLGERGSEQAVGPDALPSRLAMPPSETRGLVSILLRGSRVPPAHRDQFGALGVVFNFV